MMLNMLTKSSKAKIVKDLGKTDKDTGSPEVRIGLLSEQINHLTAHLQLHKKDTHSRRGLVIMVAERRKLLNYLKKNNNSSYEKILTKVGLK
jgi:small subunit ribosomal protein S15